MADEEQDQFASIIDNCCYSSSQDELLTHVQFTREGVKFPDNFSSPDTLDSGASSRELDGTDEIATIHGGESTAVSADSARANNLGFAGERQLEGYCGEESEKEPELQICKVSPLIHCSERKVNEDEEVVVVPDEDERREPKKKLEFGGDTEVIKVEEEQEEKEVVEFGGDTEVINVQEDERARRGKRELPRSMFGLVWDVGTEYANGDVEDGMKVPNIEENKDEMVADSQVENDLREASVEGNRDYKSKDGEQKTTKCILDALRLLVSENFSEDGGKIDIFETAKLCGMTFPRSRFLPEIEEDE